jgi:hypothetical protein
LTRATIAGGVCATLLVLLAVAAGYRALDRDVQPAEATSTASTPSTAPPAAENHPAAETHQGFLYGRITTVDGATFEGRLRFGGDQEAFWGDYFNGKELENPWLAHVPPERLPKEDRRSFEIFGIKIGRGERQVDVGRQFMARFGEIARIEAHGREVRVTLKSGTAFDLDRLFASDFDDGVRVWYGRRGVADLKSLRIRTIELFPTPAPPTGSGAAPYRPHGTVRTRQGDFTGFVGWDRDDSVGSDELEGRTAEGELGLRFDTIGSIARRSRDSALVTLLDGREIVLSDSHEVGARNRGISVDDRRYGRVEISWDTFERVDFQSRGSGPAYGDFPPGHPLTGSVTTRAGRRLAGRLVYDLDESETTDTLDADDQGLHYTIPFGLIASIAPPGRGERGGHGARVTLHNGEELRLERTGDLREENAGLLIFADGRERPDHVPWTDVERVDFDRPPATYPPLGGR